MIGLSYTIDGNPAKHVRTLLKHVGKSDHKQHKIAAAIVRGGSIIKVGWNHSFIHAEHSVLNRAWRSDVEGTTLLVIRVRKDGSLGMAKPCHLCMSRLSQAGIKKIIFSNNDGSLESLKLASNNDAPMYLEYHFISKNPRKH